MVDAPEYLIRKNGYYYRPNCQGYTSNPDEAGRYTLDYAIRICHPNGPTGPRDGMDWIHQSKVKSPSRQSTAALQAKLDAAEARALKAERMNIGFVQSMDAMEVEAEALRARVAVLDGALREARHEVRRSIANVMGIETKAMHGDNLAVSLCSYFERHEEEASEDGWTPAATQAYEEIKDAIESRFAPVERIFSQALTPTDDATQGDD